MGWTARFWLALLASAGIFAGVMASHAQDYPGRAITLIVPYPPVGGGGNIGTRAVAKAAFDGYMLLLGHTGKISVNPSL